MTVSRDNFFSALPYPHHAYVVAGGEGVATAILEQVNQAETSYVFSRHYDAFKVDDARTVKALQSEKTDLPSVFIISFTTAGNEAQNAMLKVVEEPTPNTFFILVTPNPANLLATLQSRLEEVSAPEIKDLSSRIPVSSFVGMTLAERFDMIKDLTDKKSDEPITKGEVASFLDHLEQYLREQGVNDPELLHLLFDSRRYLSANGASIKMILETIAMHL
ncbi:hypothetical protein KC929_01615 [Patescibacteria group bacterium]|nr:hypothetical protein [Patescibacteria group bacterium]